MFVKNKSTYSEEELVRLLKAKDEHALNYLYDNYANNILFIISRIIRNRDAAEDALQESFQKIWQSIDSYSAEKGRLYTWMVNVARNLAIDKTRSKDFKNQQKNQTIENPVLFNSAEKSSEINIDGIGVSDLLKTLKDDHRVLVELIYFKGFTHVETSEELGIPLGTVKTRLRMAIKELRKFYNIE